MRHQVLGCRADPVHAGVDLHVDGHGPAGDPGRRREGLDAAGGVQRRREPVGQRRVGGVGTALAEQQHGSRDAVLAQLHSLVDQRDGESPRAPGHGRPGHRRPAVPVAVGLDHRTQLGRRRDAGQHGGVVGHGRQVDLGPGRARATLGHRDGVVVRGGRSDEPHRRALSHPRPPGSARARPGPTAPGPPGPAGRPRRGPRAARARPPARARGRPAPPRRAVAGRGRRRRR